MKNQNLVMLAFMGMIAGVAMQAKAEGMQEMQVDCSKLSPDEQTFASEMSDENRKVFCGKFSARQRKSAMMLSCNGPSNCGSPTERAKKQHLSPDASVEKVMQDNNMSMQEKREAAGEKQA